LQLTTKSLQQIIQEQQPVIGFWGAPSRQSLEQASLKNPGLPFFDLDVFYNAPFSKTVPDAYCHIIRNCIDNAIALGPLLKHIVAATGEEKCDAARYAAKLLLNLSDATIDFTTNHEKTTTVQPLLCMSKGPLKKRIIRIMESIVTPLTEQEKNVAFMTQCTPTHGFWGTPPHPIEMLDLFPETTHIFGWTRCVEQKAPADLNLEMFVTPGLPTIFFAQGFCAKAMLAKKLAEKFNGMYVDVHDSLNAATMAKIEAFIRLSQSSNNL
jgi:hypothetical protein